ncbi:hypothetical protein B0A48_16064 [Cryoendolithus antarcticus]|uniref:Uncharacterized protein n=1 Tax=Cryoendolithus antarcticus TaxID=1507870 RepID=A0A1V8SF66_9PEZI|nr:hypothetical protein B0A48_16064 [Cryoendolithus antarcticus]
MSSASDRPEASTVNTTVDIATRCKQLPNDVPMWQLTELMEEFRDGVIARIKVEPIAVEDWHLAAETCFALLEKPTLAPLDRAQVHLFLAGMCLDGDIAVQEDHLISTDDILTWFEREVAVGGCGEEIGRYARSLRRKHGKLSYAILDALMAMDKYDSMMAHPVSDSGVGDARETGEVDGGRSEGQGGGIEEAAKLPEQDIGEVDTSMSEIALSETSEDTTAVGGESVVHEAGAAQPAIEDYSVSEDEDARPRKRPRRHSNIEDSAQ